MSEREEDLWWHGSYFFLIRANIHIRACIGKKLEPSTWTQRWRSFSFLPCPTLTSACSSSSSPTLPGAECCADISAM